MKKEEAEPYRDIDFSVGRRGPVIEPEPRKISIRLDNRNYQTLINDTLVGQIQQSSMLDAVRQVLREEISAGRSKRP